MSISDAYVRVECDSCGAVDEIGLTALAGHGVWDERDVKRRIERMGWKETGEDAHLCESCVDDGTLEDADEAL